MTAVGVAHPALAVEGPDNGWAVHDCGYAPLLTAGRLVKKHDPAWQMAEKTRDPGCLTERIRFRAVFPPGHKVWPGYELGFFHSHDSRREYPGYPDCNMWGDHGDLVRELKRMGEVPKPAQVGTLTRMRRAGRDVGVWWPCCWYSGRIDRELAAIAGRPLLGRHGHRDLPAQPGEPGYVRYEPDSPPSADGPGVLTAGTARRLELVHDVKHGPDWTGNTAPTGALQLLTADGPVTGYLVAAGTVTEQQGAAIARIRVWLRDHGISPMATPFPWHVVTDVGHVHVHVAGPATTGSRGRRPRAWIPVDADGFPTDLIASLATVTVAVDSVDQAKHVIQNHPANARGAHR